MLGSDVKEALSQVTKTPKNDYYVAFSLYLTTTTQNKFMFELERQDTLFYLCATV